MTSSALAALPPLRDVIARHQLMAKKSLGQHFLCDLQLTQRIADSAGDLTGVTAIEIGPGPGGLTRAILGTNAARVIAIEKDERCLAALAEIGIATGTRLEVLAGDAMQVDTVTLCDAPRAIIANLPYNIGTELLIGWLKNIDDYRSLTLMFQKEVAERIIAVPSTKAYGRLSILAQFCCNVKRVMDIPAIAFTPPPKIDSTVVQLTPRTDRPRDVPIKVLERLTAAGFGQRRKMLRVSLKPLGGEALLIKAGIEPTLRAENLTVDNFVTLARLLNT